jgi:hypothetical protein
VALGFGTPALGLLADFTGLGTVFVASMLAAVAAAAIAAAILHSRHAPCSRPALAHS